MWFCMWKSTISVNFDDFILIRFLDYFNIFALCEQFWKNRILGPLLRRLGPLLVPFLLKIGSPLGPLFRIFGSPLDCGTVVRACLTQLRLRWLCPGGAAAGWSSASLLRTAAGLSYCYCVLELPPPERTTENSWQTLGQPFPGLSKCWQLFWDQLLINWKVAIKSEELSAYCLVTTVDFFSPSR